MKDKLSAPRGLVMGIDGGGSRTTAWLADASGKILGVGTAGASNYQSIGEAAAKAELLKAIQEAFNQAGMSSRKLDSLCMGLAGYGRDYEQRMMRDWAVAAGLSDQVLVVNDAELLLWAATPEGWGLGLVCGTGSIAFGKAFDGRTARAGGWGYLIGDEGSGYDLGLAALRAAVQSADQRIPPTRLQSDVLLALGLGQVEELVAYLYQGNSSREAIAKLAGLVFAAARDGDDQANQIVKGAAAELAKAALAVCEQLGWQGLLPCALGGGLFKHHPELVQQVLKYIRRRGIHLDPVQVAHEPVAGAVRLAQVNLERKVRKGSNDP